MDIEAIDLTDVGLWADGPPADALRALREQDPVHWSPPPAEWDNCPHDGAGFWSLTRAREIAEVAPDVQTYAADRGWYLNYETDAPVPLEALQGMLTGMQPPRHTHHRALLTRAFVPNTVNRLEGQVRERMTRILDRVIEQGSCDLVTDIAVPLPVQVIADLLGFPDDSADRVFSWSLRLAATQDPEARGGGPEASLAALQEIVEYSNEIADMRRRDPRDDLLTRLAGAEVDGQAIGREALGTFVLQLIVAGNETTRNALAVGTMMLLEDRDEWRRLVEDREAIPGAVEEILRWSTPVYYMRRTATRDTELGGRRIAEGDKVVQWLVAANRDPALNDDPERFDSTREAVEHQTFGGLLSMPVGFPAGARRGPAPSAAAA